MLGASVDNRHARKSRRRDSERERKAVNYVLPSWFYSKQADEKVRGEAVRHPLEPYHCLSLPVPEGLL